MTYVSRHHETTARRLASAETIVFATPRAKTDPSAPRLPLPAAPDAPWSIIRIDRPGTYRLSADVIGKESTVGILICADHVTLDLAGFNVVGGPGSLSGIRAVGARTNICIRNGTIRGWGAHGIDLADASESHVDSLRVTENAGDGIRLGANASADKVESWSNARDGLAAGDGSSIRRSQSRANAGAGISLADSGVATDCTAIANAGHGIQAGAAALVRSCIARHNRRAGIAVADLASIRDCELIHNDADAIIAGAECVVADNRCIPSPTGRSIVAGPNSILRDNLLPRPGRHAA